MTDQQQETITATTTNAAGEETDVIVNLDDGQFVADGEMSEDAAAFFNAFAGVAQQMQEDNDL